MSNSIPPKYVGDFDDLSLSDAWEHYAMLVGYMTNTYKIPLSQIKALFDAITEVIPSAATSLNQLADKAYVDFGVEQVAAKYLSADAQGNPFSSYQAFTQGPFYYAGTTADPTKNDYALVNGDETHDNAITRYWYNGSSWDFQYVVNNSPLNQQQLDALNSTITATKVGNYDSHIANSNIHVTTNDKSAWSAKYDKPNEGIPKSDLSSAVQTSLGKADTSVQPSDVQKDSVPTKNSNNLLSSGTIYDQLQVWTQAINNLKQSLDNLAALTTFSNLTVDNLQLSSMFKIGSSDFVTVGTATPVGNVETEFFGQIYIDSTNKVGYIAVAEGGNTSAYWKQITA